MAVRDESRAGPVDVVEFRVLGGFEALAGSRRVTPSAPKLRQALALLVAEHDQTVPVHHLIDELWGAAPPRQATKTVHTYVYELRRGLPPLAGTGQLLQTRPNGYRAVVPPGSLDLTEFEALARAGGEALASRDPGTAREHLARALALWRGPALSNLTAGSLLAVVAARLEESRLRAVELRIDADLLLHRHGELVGELKALSAGHPFHEGIHAKLMLALYRCGRRSEALAVYRSLHRRLADELGLGPGSPVRRLHQLMLVADPALEPPVPPAPAAPPSRAAPLDRGAGSGPSGTAAPAPPAEPPAHLPPDIPDFTGRQRLVRAVREALAAGPGRTAVPVVSLTGMPGIGKTTTAVHIGHMVAGAYPDGQLYLRLGGSGGAPGDRGQPTDGWQPLAWVLRSLGLAGPGTGSGEGVLPEQVAAYRTWTARRQLLVVLDDAGSAEQVEPLLPSGPGCAVLITSRSPLYGLPSVRQFPLPALPVTEGVRLLSRIIGAERVRRDRSAAADIVALVGGLPLAIRSLGQRLAAVPGERLAELARRLSEARGRNRLAELAYAGTDLRARLAASYHRLPGPDQSAFRLLALLREADFTAGQAADVFRTDQPTAELTLLRLAEAQLVQAAGEARAGARRYRLHELVRPYTLECIAADR